MPGHTPYSISCHVSDFNLQAASSVQLESSNSRQLELPCTQTVQVLISLVHADINSHHIIISRSIVSVSLYLSELKLYLKNIYIYIYIYIY